MRRGHKTLWVRRFKHEATETAATFFTDKLRAYLGITDDNFKMNGRKGYAKVKGQWVCFLKVVYLSETRALRSAEDSAVDTIIFDEFTTTPERYKLYRGNEVADFIDLVISTRRTNAALKVFFLGNKETAVTSPYFDYLRIPAPELNFNGIRAYKRGSIAVEVRDDLPQEVAESYARKISDALDGTPYYEYLTRGKSKEGAFNVVKCPKNARKILQVDFIGACSLWAYGGKYYVKTGVDAGLLVFVDTPAKPYRKLRVFAACDKRVLSFIADAYKNGVLFYDDARAYEYITPFIQRLI